MKYVLGVLGVVLVTVLAVVLISSRGGDKKTSEKDGRPVVVSEQNKEGTSVQLTTQGRLVGQDERRAIAIYISQNERRLEILSGYEEALESSQTFPNTPAAYETFLVALERAGFSRERKTKDTDERGACPLGRRYIYELRDNGESLIRLWDTNCSKLGTFDGNEGTVRALFELQIPNYRDHVRNVKL